MSDYLDILATSALQSIEEGYYTPSQTIESSCLSLRESLLHCESTPIISEIKFASPSLGTLRPQEDWSSIAKEMERGGAAGISVLTEPKHFKGRLEFIAEVREQVRIPILMKDFIINHIQLDAASKVGADAVLLIQTLFNRNYCEKDVQSMIEYAHSRGLEILLETHTGDEFTSAIRTEADLIGINNRNLKTLKVDLDVTKRILSKYSAEGRVIVSESGVNTPNDIHLLHACGAHAFLVGSSIMKATNITEKIAELVSAL